MGTPRSRAARSAAVVVSASAVVLALVPATASAQIDPPAPGTVNINLLDINDFHGRIDANTVKFAGTIEQLRAEGGEENTLFVAAGDNVGASLFASSSAVNPDGSANPDKPTLDVLNALELNTSAVGNHELDRGLDDLTGRITDQADYSYTAANIYTEGTEDPVFEEYDTFEVEGLTVAVIGAITEETSSLVSPSGIAGIEFGDPTDAINRVAGELSDGDDTNGEADVIVASVHEGATEGASAADTIEAEIAAGGAFAKLATETVAEVDAIFTGHTHREYVYNGPVPGSEDTRPIVQTGSYGANIGQVVLNVDAQTGARVDYTARTVARVDIEEVEGATDEENDAASAALDAALIAQYPRVAEVDDITQAALEAAEVVGSVPVGSTDADITRAFNDGTFVDGVYTGGTRDSRLEESAAGNIIANAVRDTEIPSGEVPDIGIINPGGIRDDIDFNGVAGSDTNNDGVITTAEAVAVQPFANSLFLVTLTGTQLDTLLEQQYQPADSSRPYLALGLSDNVSFTYDDAREQGDRITSIVVDGAPVAAADTFRLATNSFLASGGDNFTVLGEGADPTDTGLIDLDVFVDAIAEASPVSPDFGKRGASVNDLSASESAPAAGDTITFTVADLSQTSLGAPQVTSVTAALGDTELGRFDVDTTDDTLGAGDVQTGSADVEVTIPAGLTGNQLLTVTADQADTTVSIPLTVGEATPEGTAYLAVIGGAPAFVAEPTGVLGDLAVAGDFTNDGTDTVGTFQNSAWTLPLTADEEITFSFGRAGDLPLVGDWDGDGVDTVGVYRSGQVFLRNTNSTGPADVAYTYGRTGDLPFAGDFNGNGTDTVGIYRGRQYFITNTPGGNVAETVRAFGRPGDLPLAGDFEGNGVDSVGVTRGASFFLSNSTQNPQANYTFSYGRPGDQYLAGAWTGLPFDGVGAFRV